MELNDYGILIPCFAALACLLAEPVVRAAEPSAKPTSAEREGTLEIVGKGIEKLVIGGPLPAQEHVFDRPGPSVPLPGGRYWIKELVLRGGFQRRPRIGGPDRLTMNQFTIVPGQTCRLELWAALTSTVTAQRRGRVLKLDYALVGADAADGWQYSSRDRSAPPRFTIYQGGREIGSGTFEYG
jgi:hypothetical protein